MYRSINIFKCARKLTVLPGRKYSLNSQHETTKEESIWTFIIKHSMKGRAIISHLQQKIIKKEYLGQPMNF